MNGTAILTRKRDYYTPWLWSLKIVRLEHDLFQPFIEQLKQTIPYLRRKYNAPMKSWSFHDEYIEDVERLLDAYGIEYTIEGAERTDQRRQPTAVVSRQQALSELYLLPNAPSFIIDAVYRTLAKKYHPDAGGTTEAMQRLNSVMEVLR